MSDPYVPPDSNESPFADERPVTTDKPVTKSTAAESRTEPVPVKFATSPPAPRIVIENEGPNVRQPSDQDGTEGFVGVDPVYKNYGSIHGKPIKADEDETEEPTTVAATVHAGPATGDTNGPSKSPSNREKEV